MGAPKRELEDIAAKRPLVSGEKEANLLKSRIGETHAAIVGVEQRASPESDRVRRCPLDLLTGREKQKPRRATDDVLAAWEIGHQSLAGL